MRRRFVIVIMLSTLCLRLAGCGGDKSSNSSCLTEIVGATEFRSGIWSINDTTLSCVPFSRPSPYATKSDTFCVQGADFYYRYFDAVWQTLGEKWPNFSSLDIEVECITGEVSDSTLDLTWRGQFAGTPDCVEVVTMTALGVADASTWSIKHSASFLIPGTCLDPASPEDLTFCVSLRRYMTRLGDAPDSCNGGMEGGS